MTGLRKEDVFTRLTKQVPPVQENLSTGPSDRRAKLSHTDACLKNLISNLIVDKAAIEKSVAEKPVTSAGP